MSEVIVDVRDLKKLYTDDQGAFEVLKESILLSTEVR